MAQVKDDGGPAFPFHIVYEDEHGNWNKEACDGMTLRDWFATMYQPTPDELQVAMAMTTNEEQRRVICKAKYAHADAMLKERAK